MSTALLTLNQLSLTFSTEEVQQAPAESAAQYQHQNMDWVWLPGAIMLSQRMTSVLSCALNMLGERQLLHTVGL